MDSLDNFTGTYNEHLVNLACEKKIPISGTFELLPACNMKCRMCYIQHSPTQDIFKQLQPVDFWEDIFHQAIAEGMLFPLITGGEPFLYPDFLKLYEKIINMGVCLCINTNATLLTRDKVAFLAKHPPRRINISLYGSSSETYQSLCKHERGFEQVLQAFDLLKEYNIPFRVHSTLVPENIKDYDGIINICNQYQVPLEMTYYMFPPYRKDGNDTTEQTRFTSEEMAKIALRYIHDRGRGDSQDYLNYIYKITSTLQQPQICSLYNNNCVTCRGGNCTFWIDWRGNISSCGVHNQFGHNLKQLSFKEAWKNIVNSTEKIRISEKCKTCKYRCICPVCPAASFCETGSISDTPQYLCDFCNNYGELLLNERKRLFK